MGTGCTPEDLFARRVGSALLGAFARSNAGVVGSGCAPALCFVSLGKAARRKRLEDAGYHTLRDGMPAGKGEERRLVDDRRPTFLGLAQLCCPRCEDRGSAHVLLRVAPRWSCQRP
jgi:hypothetical protein